MIPFLLYCWFFVDKYGTAYGGGGQSQMYIYHHEEDESTFKLVDTAKPQRPMHQKPRGRQMQVTYKIIVLQWNLSIPDTLGPQKTVLIVEVFLFHRFIYTHLYCNGTTTHCPHYRGVLISECPQ